MKCAIYARISTTDERQDLNSKLAGLREYCQRVGIVLEPIGRKPSAITVTEVCDALHREKSIMLAAKSLGCSRGYIYKALNTVGKKPLAVINSDT